MLILIDPGFQAPRFAELLASLGVSWEQGIVMEGDQGMRITGNPFFLLPELVDHEITAPLNKARLGVSYPASTALKESNLKRRDSTLSVLLRSSYNSWFRASLDDSTPTQKAGEAKGPFALAYGVEIMRDEGKADPARLVVAGSSFFINPSNPAMAPGNRDLFLNMVSWTLNRKEGASISPKYFFSLPFQADGVATLILLAVFVVLIPGGILAAGVVLWLRRKNR
jgi:ABC-2 type transport system permease protein